MTLTQYILMVLLSLAPAGQDGETWEERTARMTTVAQAINDAAQVLTCSGKYTPSETMKCTKRFQGDPKDLALMLVAKGWWESLFAKNVHEGKCREFECDATKINGTIVHRARTPWQMQKTGLLKDGEWETMVGTDVTATTTAARAAGRLLSSSYQRCANGVHGAFSGYAGTVGCHWEGVLKRVEWFKRTKAMTPEALEKRAKDQEEKLNARLAKKSS